jgi:hypothetical protein
MLSGSRLTVSGKAKQGPEMVSQGIAGVGGRPQKRRGKSGRAVNVRQMSDIPCGRYFSRAHTGRSTSQLLEESGASYTKWQLRL